MVAKKKTRKGKKAPSLHITKSSQFGALKDLMGKSPVILVLVYADWCGHCQHFKPDWKSLEQLPNRNMSMVSIRDDVFSSSPLNNMVTAEGYPTIAVVKTASNTAVNLPTRDKAKLTNVVTNAPMIAESPSPLNSNVKNVMNNSGISTANYVNTENMFPENDKNVIKSKSTPKPISNNLPVTESQKPSPPKSELDFIKESNNWTPGQNTPSRFWRNDMESEETPSATDFDKYPVKKGSQAGGNRSAMQNAGKELMKAGNSLLLAGGMIMGGGLWDGITNYRNHALNNIGTSRTRKNRRNRRRTR
jgi:thiol-disulfide isomerase/thioredoxin